MAQVISIIYFHPSGDPTLRLIELHCGGSTHHLTYEVARADRYDHAALYREYGWRLRRTLRARPSLRGGEPYDETAICPECAQASDAPWPSE